jgi:methylenetetrahydrofolate--tRNA-(uracil-5-)-methyltransferase
MMLQGEPIRTVPRTTALGALAFYISHARAIDYQPTNVTFGIIPELDRQVRGKKQRREAVSRRALEHLDAWILERGIER